MNQKNIPDSKEDLAAAITAAEDQLVVLRQHKATALAEVLEREDQNHKATAELARKQLSLVNSKIKVAQTNLKECLERKESQMNSNYKKILAKVESIENEIEAQKKRKIEAQERLRKNTAAIDALETDLRDALIAGDKKKANTLSNSLLRVRNKTVTSDEYLIEGIDQKLVELDENLRQTKIKRDELFAKLTVSWLQKECNEYDAAARKVVAGIKRLLVCHNLLRQLNQQDTYVSTVGKACSYLPATKVPIVKNFDQTAYIGNTYHAGQEVISQVRREIESQ